MSALSLSQNEGPSRSSFVRWLDSFEKIGARFNSDKVSRSSLAKQRGAAELTQSGLSMALSAMAMVGLMGVYANYKSDQEATECVSQINDLAATIQEEYKSVGSFNGISEQVMVDSGTVNSWVRNGRLSNPIGNQIQITSDQTDFGDGSTDHFILAAKYPRKACIRILTADFGDDVVHRTPSGSSTTSGIGNDYGPMDPSQASALCRQNGQLISLTFKN